MTCIVGVVSKDGSIYIGGDSAAVAGYSIVPRKDPKVFIKDGFIFGFTTSFRMGDIIRYSWDIPKIKANQDLDHFMRKDFIDNLRECFIDKGFNQKKDEQDEGGTFLVGFRGRLFEVDCDYQVGESLYPYGAVGCGTDLALGALFVTETLSPEKRVVRALEAAAEFSAGVCPPFNVLCLPYTKSKKK
jgi:20S proteasome alpha/beta subunit